MSLILHTVKPSAVCLAACRSSSPAWSPQSRCRRCQQDQHSRRSAAQQAAQQRRKMRRATARAGGRRGKARLNWSPWLQRPVARMRTEAACALPALDLLSTVQVCWLSPAANPSDVSSLCSLGFASLPGQTCSLTQLLTQLLRFDCAMCVTSCSRARGASCGVNEWNRALSPTSLRPADQEPPRLLCPWLVQPRGISSAQL